MRTVDGEPIPRSVPTPGAQYVKSLGGSVWLGAVVIVAERGVADFDLCSFESHVPRVSDVVERDLSCRTRISSFSESPGQPRYGSGSARWTVRDFNSAGHSTAPRRFGGICSKNMDFRRVLEKIDSRKTEL